MDRNHPLLRVGRPLLTPRLHSRLQVAKGQARMPPAGKLSAAPRFLCGRHGGLLFCPQATGLPPALFPPTRAAGTRSGSAPGRLSRRSWNKALLDHATQSLHSGLDKTPRQRAATASTLALLYYSQARQTPHKENFCLRHTAQQQDTRAIPSDAPLLPHRHHPRSLGTRRLTKTHLIPSKASAQPKRTSYVPGSIHPLQSEPKITS